MGVRARSIALVALALAGSWTGLGSAGAQAAVEGYYRQPALHGETLLFVAEGDIWKVDADGGRATRLTSHPGDESYPRLSPDGSRVAFRATYEGPTELYTMPLAGGLPVRRTFGLNPSHISGWKDADSVLFATQAFSTLPDAQLVLASAAGPNDAGVRERIPLAQAADGAYADDGTLYFTRRPFQGSHTKRYKGGTIQNIWRFRGPGQEAEPLTRDYPGTSKRPMPWNGRVYFASDRDGTMNLWSMAPDGGELQQHTRHSGLDIKDPVLQAGRVVYQRGADLWRYDIASGRDRRLTITLDTDLEQQREHWVDEATDYLTSAHLSPDGDRLALTARGKVFVAPVKQGRFVQTGARRGVRHRDASFMPDGKTILVLSDASGEVELWTEPANGVGEGTQWTSDGKTLRWEAIPSPNGKQVAHHDKNGKLFLLDVDKKRNREIDSDPKFGYSDLAWSPDSRWLAFVKAAPNSMSRVFLYDTEAGRLTPATSDRYNSYSPAWGVKGDFLYFISDRNLVSVVPSPWGAYQPEPFLDKRGQLFHIALRDGLRSPFLVDDEAMVDDEAEDDGDDEDGLRAGRSEHGIAGRRHKEGRNKRGDDGNDGQGDEDQDGDEDEDDALKVEIDSDGLIARLTRIDVAPGNYFGLTATASALYFVQNPTGGDTALKAIKIGNDKAKPKVETVVSGIRGYELSMDGKKLLVRKGSDYYVVDAKPGKASLKQAKVDLSGWSLSTDPREEWRQMFTEAWRLERDYFYDPSMHGVDWKAMHAKYLPLVDRVTTRAELSDLIAQMVAELSALHIFVRGGDMRDGDDDVAVASLGARILRDERAGGYRVDHLYAFDPDEPDRRGPLQRPEVDAAVGDVITHVDGVASLSVPDIGALLRRKVGKQVLITLKPAGGESREAIVRPISQRRASDLRYHAWEHTRRLQVEQASDDQIGYVHLRAMGRNNYTEWAKHFYPVHDRQGLIIDVRHNRGGNIDSWILGRLMRKAWFYWNLRSGVPMQWNMQYAFRGHVAVLVDGRTASDGEAFAEGIKRLDLGEVIGMRTWGGEIWLTSSNVLVDGGIASAAEFGVYGPEGTWLVEGHGVEPDQVVDNPPHAAFRGEDPQLEAAIQYLKQRIREEPVEDWPVPAYPDKSFRYPTAGR